MDVLLVPVGDNRYELYCEPVEADHPSSGAMTQLLRLRGISLQPNKRHVVTDVLRDEMARARSAEVGSLEYVAV